MIFPFATLCLIPLGSDLKKGPHKLKGDKAVPYTPPTDIGKDGIIE